jgi:hypothetical protein
MQLHNFGTLSRSWTSNRAASSDKASCAPRYTSLVAMTSSESTATSFPSLSASPRAGFFSSVKIPRFESLLVAKMGVRETSWQRKVQRFLTSLSEGFDLTVVPGDEQMSMKAAMDRADLACILTSSSFCEYSCCQYRSRQGFGENSP